MVALALRIMVPVVYPLPKLITPEPLVLMV